MKISIRTKQKFLFAILVLLTGCTPNHQHDGLYMANKRVTGVTKVWILEGDALTVYAVGETKVFKCDQYADRIEVKGGEIYYLDGKDDILISKGPNKSTDYRMVRVSDKTKYSFAELDRLVDEAYDKERKSRSAAKPR
jgi:hypothetical protein